MISFKMLDDWDRRVVIRRRELVPAEEAKLPWHKPPLEMYRRVTEAIHGLDMLKVSIRSYRLFVVFFCCCCETFRVHSSPHFRKGQSRWDPPIFQEGDKVLVCLSGGKDSLSLLHILHFYQMRCRKNKRLSVSLKVCTPPA